MKYKITNPLEQTVRCGDLVFGPKETKKMAYIPGDGFHVEKIEEKEEKSLKGGK